MAERKLLFELNNFKIYEDSKFSLKNKKDSDAPLGLRKIGATKFPGTGEDIIAQYVNERNSEYGVYDLGFEPSSIFYRYNEDKVALAKSAKDNILKPYFERVKKTGETLSDYINSESIYDKFFFHIDENSFFNMENPLDRFKFYILVLRKKVCPEGSESLSEFRNANYVAFDSVIKRKTAETDASEKLTVSFLAQQLIVENKKQILLNIFEWMKIPVSLTADSDNSQFSDMIVNSILENRDKREEFKSLCDKDPKILQVYSSLNKSLKKTGSNFEKVGIDFYYKDTKLGTDLKNISEQLLSGKNKDYLNIVKELILED